MKLYHKEYDEANLRVLSLGAGVQSSTVLFKILEGEIPMVDAAIFADTGNEPQEVYDYLEYLKTFMKDKIPFYKVQKSNIIEDSLAGTFLKIPIYSINTEGKKAIGRRQCTNEYKIQPIYKQIREILGVKSLKGRIVEMVMGISTDEIQRAKKARLAWQVNDYPLLELNMSRDDCKQYVKSINLKEPPRSACIVCPYRSNDEWHHLKHSSPNEFQEAVDFDHKIRNTKSEKGYKNYLHHTMQPLDTVDFKVNSHYYSGSLFDDECEGMCGL